MNVLKGQLSFDFVEEKPLYLRPIRSVQDGYEEFLKDFEKEPEKYQAIFGLEFREDNSKAIKAEIEKRYKEATTPEAKNALAELHFYVFGGMQTYEMMYPVK